MKFRDKFIATFMSFVLAIGLCPGFAVADDVVSQPEQQPKMLVAQGMTAQAELADGTYTVAGLSAEVLSMYHFNASAARVVIRGDEAWLITSPSDESTVNRFDGMAYGPQSAILDPSDTTNHTLIAGTPVANVINTYDDDDAVVGRTFVLPVPKSVFENGSDIYYMIKYRAGYSDKHDGDWYEASGGDYYLTGYTLAKESDDTTLPGEEPASSLELAITNNVSMFSVDPDKDALLVGSGDAEMLTIPMKSSTKYVEAFVGSFEEASAATSTIAIADDKTFTIPASEIADGTPILVSFKTTSWYERKMTLDREAKTLTFDPSEADYTAVNAAIAAAPTEQGNYTDSSWAALQEALGAVVTGKFASQQAEVDAMAAAINDAIAGLKEAGSVSLEDGIYALPTMVAGPSSMFNHMEADSRVLIVSGDKATIAFTEDGSTASVGKYSRLALGKTSEILAGKDNYCPDSDLPEGTTIIEGVEQDKTAANARWRFDIELPKADVETMLANSEKLYVTVWNNAGASGQNIPGWYIPTNDIYVDLGAVGELATTQKVTFVPQDNKTGERITGATVTVTDSNNQEVTASEGTYNLTIGESYTVAVAAEGYRDASSTYTVKAGECIKSAGAWPLDYHYWMQVRGTKRIAEQTYSLHGQGEVVKIKTETATEWTTVEPPTGTYYEFHNLQVGETYTITVDAPEGYALVTTSEWSVPDHGYINETDGETHWEKTFTVTDEKEFLGNLIVNFVEYTPASSADWTAVDAALAKVPGQVSGDLKYFTDESAAAVTVAVNAVDRSEANQDAVDAMAANIETALKGLVPKDGRYEVTFDKANNTPYYVYEGLPASTKPYGMGVLVVEDGSMTLEAVVQGSSYGYARLGTKDEAIAAAPDEDTQPAGTITLTENADNSANRDVVLPVAKFNEQLQYTYHSSNLERYKWTAGWYDHGLIFRANSVTPLDSEEPVEYLTVTNTTGMFKVMGDGAAATSSIRPHLTTLDNDQQALVFYLSGVSYDNLFKGTYEQAVAAGDGRGTTWIAAEHVDAGAFEDEGVTTGNDYWCKFTLPIEEGETYIPLVSVSNSYLDKYDAGQNSLARAFYPRQFTIDLEAMTLVSGDYAFSQEIAVHNNVSMFSPGATATLNTVGGPNSNNYAANLVLPMTSASMSEVFVGTPAEAAAAESTIAFDAENKTFTIPVKWVDVFGQPETTKSLCDGEPFVISFKSARNGSWYGRQATLSEEDGTLVFDPWVALAITNNVSMFSVDSDKDALLAGSGDAEMLTIPMKSSTKYVEAFVGSFEEASAATSTIAIADDKTFTIPASEIADGTPILVSFKTTSWYERKMTLDREAKTLTFDPSAADYSAVETQQAAAAALTEADYTAESWAALQEALGAVVTGKFASQQDEVDAMAKAIEDAIEGLVPVENKVVYDLKPYNDEKMYVVVKVVLEDYADGQDYLTYYLNGTRYSHAFLGTQDEAVATWKNGQPTDARWAGAKAETIDFEYVKSDGTEVSGTAQSKPGYRMPVTIPSGTSQFTVPVVAYVEGSFTARSFTLDLDAMKAQTGSASDVATLAVTSSVKDIAAAAKGTIEYTGYISFYAGNMNMENSPLSNDWVSSLSINIGKDGIYDEAYAVTYQGRPWLSDATANDPLDADKAKIAADGALVLPVINEYDTNPKTAQLDGNIIKVMMHVAKTAPYVEAGTWVERTFQLDFTNRTAATLAISGDPLTLKAADYSAVEAAKAKAAKIDRSKYTDASLKKLDDAIAAAVAGKPATEQAAVNAMAKAIEDAIKALEEKPAPVELIDISGATIAKIPNQPYTGKAIEPALTVTLGGKTLKAGTDYTVGYAENVKLGIASVRITGMGNYTGTNWANFEIVKSGDGNVDRLFGETMLDTMAEIVDEGWAGETGGTVVLTTVAGYWDALTAAGIAGMNRAPVLMTDRLELSAQTAAELKKLAPKKIIVCGGPAVVADDVVAAAAAAAGGAETVQIYGETMTDTADEVYKQAPKEAGGTWNGIALLCTSNGYWDALAAAPLSYGRGMPILLTDSRDSVSASTLKVLQSEGIQGVIIVGGNAVVSEAVEKQLDAAGVRVFDRLWGETAIETSMEVAEYALTFNMRVDLMGIATQNGYWDALSGAALCGKLNSVLVLVDDVDDSPSVDGFVKKHADRINKAWVFGGKFAVNEAVFEALKAAVK